ncbi:putative Peptide-N(4)-(N-acetyl-beta-glucosaminyl)asparagine amidase [Hypsibius exemplaris]|uniref:Peptide-N(4)-(N-acetyl-beta-glucosaminyl)asparagine amidase n=1 Tax=Hypsibius exemplaris TaxID=2072580 RepID=A0A9X6NAG0_HYPEX|nr:putative Peptide-N(4)-(N-acetyl-beta-glucosaminyl)asparagine amidase [Hypsibius exemplaris]
MDNQGEERSFRCFLVSSIPFFANPPQIKMAKPQHVSEKAEFEKILKDSGAKLIVVDFYADWCGPCKNIAPKFEELSGKNGDAIFLKVNADDAQEICEEYKVNALPTFVFIKNGKVVDRIEGANAALLESKIAALKA